MKKAFLCSVIISICLSLYAVYDKVCIYPENSQISSYLKDYFSIETKHCSASISDENLLLGNDKILEYVCRVSGADFLIIPSSTDLGGFNLYQVRVFDKNSGKFELVYEHLTQDSQIPQDVIYALQPYLSEKPVEIQKEKNTEIEYIEYGNLPVNSDIPSDVYIDGQYAGTTPLLLTSYRVPSIVLFKSEGYRDLIVKIDGKLDKLNVKLKTGEDIDKDLYNTSRDKFYKSFSNLLISFGIRAAVPAFANAALPVYTALNIGSYGLLGVSAADSVLNLIKYYNNAKEVSP